MAAATRIVTQGLSVIEKQMKEMKHQLNATKSGKDRDDLLTQLNVVKSILVSVKKP